MKQEVFVNDTKSRPSPPPASAARARASSGSKESPRKEAGNNPSPGFKARARQLCLEASSAQRVRRSIPEISRTRVEGPTDDAETPRDTKKEDLKIMRRPISRVVEQYVHLRRRPEVSGGDDSDKNGSPEKGEELQRRLDASENMVMELKSQVSQFQAEIERLKSLNLELEMQKKKTEGDLMAAEDKIKILEKSCQPSRLRDPHHFSSSSVQKVVVKEPSEDSANRKQSVESEARVKIMEKDAATSCKLLNSGPSNPRVIASGPPPPPPPLSRQNLQKPSTVNKAYALVELYNSIRKRDVELKMSSNQTCTSQKNPVHSIVGELQNRSAHLLAIKADIETKGEFIEDLINKVQSAAYSNMEDVLKFVDWLDRELSTLSDETAVLKQFEWPERKADALREAAFEYRDLKHIQIEVSLFKDDSSLACEATLKKIANLLEKLEKSMTRVIKLRNSAMASYREHKIPVDWMLDSGEIRKIKCASIQLAKAHMKRVLLELDTVKNSENSEALISQSVCFAYRVHQFAGGLDSEAMVAFEELRGRVHLHERGTRMAIPGVILQQ